MDRYQLLVSFFEITFPIFLLIFSLLPSLPRMGQVGPLESKNAEKLETDPAKSPAQLASMIGWTRVYLRIIVASFLLIGGSSMGGSFLQAISLAVVDVLGAILLLVRIIYSLLTSLGVLILAYAITEIFFDGLIKWIIGGYSNKRFHQITTNHISRGGY